MKEISKNEVTALLDNGILRNTKRGLVNEKDYPSGYTTTRNKAYIEDKYADIAKEIILRNVTA